MRYQHLKRIAVIALAMLGILRLADLTGTHRHTDGCAACVHAVSSRRRSVESTDIASAVTSVVDALLVADSDQSVERSVSTDGEDELCFGPQLTLDYTPVAVRRGRGPPAYQWVSNRFLRQRGRSPPIFT